MSTSWYRLPLTTQKEEADASYVLIGVANDNKGELYVVRSVVNKYSSQLASMDVLYAINAKKRNQLRSMRPGVQRPVTDSTISIAHLLEIVNSYFPDILPESVLRHFGYDARPKGVLGKDALYSDREYNVTEREILADTLMGAAANDIEKNKLKTYKGKVKEMEAEQEKLGKIKAQIKELSFAKGKRDTEKIKRLRELAVKTENRINIYDRQFFLKCSIL